MANTASVSGPQQRPAQQTSREVLSANLRIALRQSTDSARPRDAVDAYVDEARLRGEPVERVIIDLKQEMRAARVIDHYADPTSALAESVIRWYIERYYGPTVRAD